MTLESPILGEPVEIDGIFFETFISNSVLVAQKKGTIGRRFPEGKTMFETGIRITNLTERSYYFCHLVCSEVEIISPRGESSLSIFTSPWRWYELQVFQSDFVLADAGKSVDLLVQGYLGWTANYSAKKARTKKKKFGQDYRFRYDEDTWRMFLILNPINTNTHLGKDPIIFGSYQIRFNYKLDIAVQRKHLSQLANNSNYKTGYPSYIETDIIDNSWYGEISTSFIDFRIEPNPSEMDISKTPPQE